MRRFFFRVAVDARGDAGEGDGSATVLRRESERVAVAGRQLLWLAMRPVTIDRADSMDHELRGQPEARRDPRLARGAPHARTHLRHLEARLVKLRTGGAVNRPINSTLFIEAYSSTLNEYPSPTTNLLFISQKFLFINDINTKNQNTTKEFYFRQHTLHYLLL